MLRFALIFLLAFFKRSEVYSQILFDDPCTFIPFYISGDTSGVIDVSIPDTCWSGSIQWNYPMGALHVHTSRADGPYRLCIDYTQDAVLGGIIELTGGANNVIPLPTQNDPACTREDATGKTELLIQAPTSMRYLSSLSYRIDHLQA